MRRTSLLYGEMSEETLKSHLDFLQVRYPDMEVKEPRCEDANAIHCWNRFKKTYWEKKITTKTTLAYLRKHREFFEDSLTFKWSRE